MMVGYEIGAGVARLKGIVQKWRKGRRGTTRVAKGVNRQAGDGGWTDLASLEEELQLESNLVSYRAVYG